MSNYFSIGHDARVGLGFDKLRTKKRCCNNVIYGWEGFKKMCCCCCVKTKKVKEVIDYVFVQDDEGENKVVFASSK